MSKLRTFVKIIILKSFFGSRSFTTRKLCNYRNTTPKYKLNHLGAVAFISSLLKWNTDSKNSKTHFDAEKQISKLINEAEEFIRNGNLKEAKNTLKNAIQIADDNQSYRNYAHLSDLLSSIVLTEGDFYEAENILVSFTESLLQIGYPETHNSIVQFKLKLARIYQLLGSFEMAEYGFRDCIKVQEKKLEDQKILDEESNRIYLCALFWYGELLADQQDFNRARKHYELCWERISKATKIVPSQKMVVLHGIARASVGLKDFDKALHYLYAAIEICLLEDPNNKDLAMLVVQVGLVFLQKEIYESALYWCQAGHELATHWGNEIAKEESQMCINELRTLKIVP